MNYKLTTQILIAMILGVFCGVLFQENSVVFKPIGDMFIRLLNMVMLPLVFASLVVGVVNLGSVQSLGRLGTRTSIYYITTTFIAVLIGLIMVNFIEPGVGANIDTSYSNLAIYTYEESSNAISVIGILEEIVPSNIFKSLTQENMLGIIFIALIFGSALLALGSSGSHLKKVIEDFNNVFLKITDWIMVLAPFGVFALVASMVGSTGFEVLKPIFFYVATVLIALITHLVFTLSGILIIIVKYSPIVFLKKMFPAIATAFSTDSSIVTLPVTMECIEKNIGVSKKVSSFMLPLGATINMDGTALYEAVAVVFIAQVFGFDMSITEQLIIMLTAMLASVGAAGIPSAGLVTMVIVLRSVNLPLEGIGLLLPVDRILDMFRTTVNIISDSCGAMVIATLEGEQLNSDNS
ncbi:MAG: dicarboxylate/amino acid:cation symporter [Rickettsiales bacterium]|nr:dicarboxylate/amino acid:cation symporter [Rickettsiales bacterium]|tara:strand:- start:3148 stop:4371 length:1224 start_codon:yes stop_codon:yes gene_type:complete